MKHPLPALLVVAAATGLALCATSQPSAAAQAPVPGPAQTPDAPYAGQSGEVASPGDPFLPGTATRGDKVFAVQPKLACSFKILGDGMVLIIWTNEGNGPIPTGTLIYAQSPQYYSVGWWTQKPLKPGESISIPAKIDPKQLDGLCTATIKA